MLLAHASLFTAINCTSTAGITIRLIGLILTIDMTITPPVRWNASSLIAQKSRTSYKWISYLNFMNKCEILTSVYYLVVVLEFSPVVLLLVQCKCPDHYCQSIFCSLDTPVIPIRIRRRRIHNDELFLWEKSKILKPVSHSDSYFLWIWGFRILKRYTRCPEYISIINALFAFCLLSLMESL